MRKQAVLALMRAVLDKTLKEDPCTPIEVKKIYLSIRVAVNFKINKLKKTKLKDIDFIYNKIDAWAKKSGWDNKCKHPCTAASFLILLAKNINMPDLEKMLFKVYRYYMDIDKVPAPADWAAKLSYDRWQEVWKCESIS